MAQRLHCGDEGHEQFDTSAASVKIDESNRSESWPKQLVQGILR